jgi:hypothetical protein
LLALNHDNAGPASFTPDEALAVVRRLLDDGADPNRQTLYPTPGPAGDVRINPTLSITDEDEFVEEALAKLGPQPPNFQAIVELNRGPLLTEGVEVRPLAPRQVEQKRAAGALLVDVRTDQQFDDAHIPGSLCNPMLRAGFGSKLAWLADRDQEIVFIGRDDDQTQL